MLCVCVVAYRSSSCILFRRCVGFFAPSLLEVNLEEYLSFKPNGLLTILVRYAEGSQLAIDMLTAGGGVVGWLIGSIVPAWGRRKVGTLSYRFWPLFFFLHLPLCVLRWCMRASSLVLQ